MYFTQAKKGDWYCLWTAFSIQNSVETYGIKVDGEKSFQIHFPIANDESKGAILDANGYPLYIISRTDYLLYDDVYGL